MEITTKSADAIADIKENLMRKSRPTPFLKHTIPQLYDFYKAHHPPDENYGGPGMHFTSFAFLAVDSACLSASPQEIILCSDGPEFGEGDDTIVKTKPFPITIAFEYLYCIEKLVSTMSELCPEDPDNPNIKLEPPAMMVRLPANQQDNPDNMLLFRVATPKEGREKKQALTRMYGSYQEALENTGPRTKPEKGYVPVP